MTRIAAKVYHKLIGSLYKLAYAVIAEAKSHLYTHKIDDRTTFKRE
ncbi:MAG: hypothetical protein NVS4B11_18170 [Ktedonobacteraceae bacterium]